MTPYQKRMNPFIKRMADDIGHALNIRVVVERQLPSIATRHGYGKLRKDTEF